MNISVYGQIVQKISTLPHCGQVTGSSAGDLLLINVEKGPDFDQVRVIVREVAGGREAR
jgi:hypothetical protein